VNKKLQTQFFNILLEMFVWFIIFIVAMSPILLIAWIRRRRGRGIKLNIRGTETRENDLPLLNSRVRTIIRVDGKEVEAVGTLKGYGFVNQGKGIVKYLTNVKVGEVEFDHHVELIGPKGLSTWFTSQNITSREQLMAKLGLASPKYDQLQMIGDWQEGKKPIWRKLTE